MAVIEGNYPQGAAATATATIISRTVNRPLRNFIGLASHQG